MKVVLDSSVIVAAFAARGLCHEVLEACLMRQEGIVSPDILEECRRALLKKVAMPEALAEANIRFLKEEFVVVKPMKIRRSVCRDPGDEHILGLAKAARADVIVTGDDDLLALKRWEGIALVSPREFWNLLKRG